MTATATQPDQNLLDVDLHRAACAQYVTSWSRSRSRDGPEVARPSHCRKATLVAQCRERVVTRMCNARNHSLEEIVGEPRSRVPSAYEATSTPHVGSKRAPSRDRRRRSQRTRQPPHLARARRVRAHGVAAAPRARIRREAHEHAEAREPPQGRNPCAHRREDRTAHRPARVGTLRAMVNDAPTSCSRRARAFSRTLVLRASGTGIRLRA